MANIEVQHVSKSFSASMFTQVAKKLLHPEGEASVRGDFAIQDLNLTIPDGKVLVVLGPSGCGKSTLLRLISGLMPVDAGHILYDGVDVANVPPGDRGIGMVFQNYALYPHMTSKQNILSYFFFKFKMTKPEVERRAEEKFQMTSELLGVDIEYLLDKNPTHLSGGEKQRVAIGRCITRDPKLFLLDEPFSNLDQPLREKYRGELKKLLRHFNITTVYVTHDQYEALLLADLLAIMDVGTIAQVGTPEEIYNTPASLFVAQFLNLEPDTPPINLLDGGLVSTDLHNSGAVIGIRSEDILLCDPGTTGALTGMIRDVRHVPIKRSTVVDVALPSENEVSVRLPLDSAITSGTKVGLRFRRYHLFDKESGQRVWTRE